MAIKDPLAGRVPLIPGFSYMVRRGYVGGYSHVHKFGSASGITSLVPVSTSKTYQTPTSAKSLVVVSDAAADASGGAGMQTLRVIGIGPDWTEQTADVAMNGTNNVAIDGTWLRVYRAYGLTSGTYASAAAPSHTGTVTIKESGGTVWAQITNDTGFGLGQTQIACYTIPSGKIGYLKGKPRFNIESTKTPNIYMFVRENASDVSAPYSGFMRVQDVWRTTGSADSPSKEFTGPFTGPCDIGIMASSATSASVSADFDIFLVDA